MFNQILIIYTLDSLKININESNAAENILKFFKNIRKIIN